MCKSVTPFACSVPVHRCVPLNSQMHVCVLHQLMAAPVHRGVLLQQSFHVKSLPGLNKTHTCRQGLRAISGKSEQRAEATAHLRCGARRTAPLSETHCEGTLQRDAWHCLGIARGGYPLSIVVKPSASHTAINAHACIVVTTSFAAPPLPVVKPSLRRNTTCRRSVKRSHPRTPSTSSRPPPPPPQ